jgi:spore maturation protein CgeB
MIVTVNHLGFDAEGLLAEALERLGLPTASWFVDSPAVILSEARKIDGSGLFAFSWDKSYLQTLKDLGFRNVFYLPLATDETFFSPSGETQDNLRKIAFAGDSLEAATLKYLKLSGLSLLNLPEIDAAAEKFLANDKLTPDEEAGELIVKFGLSGPEAAGLSALVIWRASRLWRQRVLSAVNPEDLTVAGDEGWRQILKGATLTGRVDYYDQLGAFYRQSAVNLNVTSAQMKSGLNQRVFDVPAAGAFLLTDNRAQLNALFEPDKEVVVYDSPEEAAEKASWYLGRPLDRRRVVARAQRRVLNEHLYRHRLKTMLELVLGGGK